MTKRTTGTVGTARTMATRPRPHGFAVRPSPVARPIFARFVIARPIIARLFPLLIAIAHTPLATAQLPIIRATPTPTPTPAATPSPTPSPTPTPTPQPTPIVLVPVEPTAAEWRASRARLFERAADLRAGLDARGDQWDATASVAQTRDDAARFRAYAVALAPDHLAAIDDTLGRLGALLDLLGEQLLAPDRRRLEATMQQIEDALVRLDELALEADLAAGRASQWGYVLRPADWGGLQYPDPLAAETTARMNARELVGALALRQRALADVNLRALDDAEPVAREMGELARALVRRQGEVRSLSRPGFRNAALRLEVMSENVIEFARNRDRLNVRRQVREMRVVLGELGAFLTVAQDTSLPIDPLPIATPPRPVRATPTPRPITVAATPRPSPTPMPSFTPLPTFTPIPTPTPQP